MIRQTLERSAFMDVTGGGLRKEASESLLPPGQLTCPWQWHQKLEALWMMKVDDDGLTGRLIML